jgi:hypothetical protein
MSYLGDFLEDETVIEYITTHDQDGGAVDPSSALEAADLDWYKDGEAFAPAGITMTSPFVSTGLHKVAVDTSNDGGDNWTTGADYVAVLTPDETVDGETVIRVVIQFSIQNRAPGNGTILTEAGGTGDQLTAINLPNQTMDIIGTITGNLIGDVTGNVDGTVAGKTPAEIGAAMNLAADAIKAISYDESTAFPLKANDAAATQVARVGADGDTLETLSDQIDGTLTLTKVIEGTITIQQAISIALAVLSGKSSGGGLVFRNEADDTDRLTITADGSGNRTNSVIDVSDL